MSPTIFFPNFPMYIKVLIILWPTKYAIELCIKQVYTLIKNTLLLNYANHHLNLQCHSSKIKDY